MQHKLRSLSSSQMPVGGVGETEAWWALASSISSTPPPRKGSRAGLGGEAMRRQLVVGSAVTRVHELLRSEDELHSRATEGSPCLQPCGDLPSREKLLSPLRLQVTREEDGVSKPWTLGGCATRAPTQASEEGDCWVGLGLCARTRGPVSIWFCKCQRNWG